MSIYGVANPLAALLAYATVGGVDVTCTADTEITVITTGALAALNPGPYYPIIWLTLAILEGGTKPNSLTLAFKIGAGSDVDTYVVEPGLLSNSGELYPSVCLVGVNSASAWIGAGSTINITVKAAAQAVTCKNVGSRAVVGLFRGPDL